MSIRYLIHGSTDQQARLASNVTLFPDANTALDKLCQEDAQIVLLCSAELFTKGHPHLPANFETIDLLHAGLRLGANKALHSLWLAGMNWHFLDAPDDQRSTNWKATPDWCWLRPEVVRRLGGLDNSYQTATCRLMDLAYRALVAGGRVCYDPFQLPAGIIPEPGFDIPLEDELIFALRRVGLKGALYIAIWLAMITRKPYDVLLHLRKAINRARSIPAPHSPSPSLSTFKLIGQKKRQQVERISAIIPTLNRYEYLPQAINSLLKQNPPPDEVIVIDQTPPEDRSPNVYEPFEASNVRVLYLEEAGQSLARNVGVEAAQNDWILLFDDDSLAWDDMIKEHVNVIERSGAQASTGLSLAPWKTRDHVPTTLRHYHLSNVLDTGNSLVRKNAIVGIDYFDRAFDHGSGADHDLGVRLYLAGFEVVFNPTAIRTHYKAPRGGLRTYGAWWRERTAFSTPYPPPTQIYTIQRYYPLPYRFPLYLLFYLRAYRRHRPLEYVALWLLLPWRFTRALREAARLSNSPIKE